MLARLFSRANLKLQVDVHSHLLPGVDDGVRSFEESIETLRGLQELGYKKAITTPHIYAGVYPNTPDIIEGKFKELERHVIDSGLEIKVGFAAEYFLDGSLLDDLIQGKRMLTFGENYVLFETPFLSKPLIFDEVVFQLKSKGYIPVLAHPERYLYLENELKWLEELSERGVLLQVNLPSFAGAYGSQVKKMAFKMVKELNVSFFGSDIHRMKQLPVVKSALKTKMKKQNPLNDSLL